MSCVFCRIASGELSSDLVLDEDEVLAFRDMDPKAPTHVLVIPRRHVTSLHDLGPSDGDLAHRLLLASRAVAEAEGLSEGGYRVVTNVGGDGGQSVPHLHFHVLGGRALGWPPG